MLRPEGRRWEDVYEEWKLLGKTIRLCVPSLYMLKEVVQLFVPSTI
jgi:hypothetical protein